MLEALCGERRHCVQRRSRHREKISLSRCRYRLSYSDTASLIEIFTPSLAALLVLEPVNCSERLAAVGALPHLAALLELALQEEEEHTQAESLR